MQDIFHVFSTQLEQKTLNLKKKKTSGVPSLRGNAGLLPNTLIHKETSLMK